VGVDFNMSKIPARILILGLPGSGKTTLAALLAAEFSPNVLWLNADAVREQYDDWDFSHAGRMRQSLRMRQLADACEKDYVVCDFVAPLVEMRTNFDAHWTIWMDTIKEGRFEDTNRVFVPPTNYDFRVKEKDAESWAKIIGAYIANNPKNVAFNEHLIVDK
jgi:adenylylsulfate kinase